MPIKPEDSIKSPNTFIATTKSKFGKFTRMKQAIVLLLLLGSGYTGYAYFFKTPTTANRVTLTATVKKGTIEDSIKTTGTANLVNEQKIRFNQLGKVIAIKFKQGDSVKQGDIIAMLDNSDALNSIKQAEINLSNARISLAQDRKPAEQKDLLQSQNAINKSKSDIASAEQNYSNLQIEKTNKLQDAKNAISSKLAAVEVSKVDVLNKESSYQRDLDSKKSQLELAKNQLNTLIAQEGQTDSNTNTDTKKAISSAMTDARKQLIDAQVLLLTVDEMFGITPENHTKNDAYRSYMSSNRSKVEMEWYTSNGLLQKYTTKYEALSNDTVAVNTAYELLSGTSDLYNSLITLGADAAETIKAGLVSTTYSQSTIDGQYSSMLSIKSQAQSAYDTIQNSKANILKLSDPLLIKQQGQNNIEKQKLTISDLEIAIANYDRDYKSALANLKNTQKNLENDVVSLRNTLLLTKKNYDAQFAQTAANITNLKSTLAVNIASADFVKKGATSEKIQMAKNDIAKQEIALSDAKKNLDKYRIEAPFDGVIRQIDFKVGDNLVSDDTKYVYIDNPNTLEISATLDQIDIAKVKIGQAVKVTFDSFADVSFTGSVTQVNSTPISTSGVTSYTIKMAMDKKDYKIYSGMTAKVTITINKKSDILVVPAEYIQTRGNVSNVTLKDATGKGIRTEVVVGLTTNTSAEIASGLNEGDEVFRFVNVASSSSGSTANSNDAIRAASRAAGGGFGGAGAAGGRPGG
ncbi:MAG: HlyD family efflux transporter periplasmic adaptor subunit [Candidatus Gracilibacteria bacterium]|nr:HlyD family efflux transporter periplasmic adaptor subunit [Candidatus Gracilibacteria bacterium]